MQPGAELQHTEFQVESQNFIKHKKLKAVEGNGIVREAHGRDSKIDESYSSYIQPLAIWQTRDSNWLCFLVWN